jgi:putative transposase
MEFQFFDRDADVLITERNLPHWQQPGCLCFITFRTMDSLPAAVVNRWRVERAMWLRARGIEPTYNRWQEALKALPWSEQKVYHATFTSRWLDELDNCHGECVLRDAKLSGIVADSFHHFDGDRYFLGDFVVMPNHVHLLVSFPNFGQLGAQCDSWKSFTARQINRHLGRSGAFWQDEGFDHLVRSPEQFEYLRSYIADNPRKANLRDGEFRYYRAPM